MEDLNFKDLVSEIGNRLSDEVRRSVLLCSKKSLTTDEAADYMGLSKSSMYKMAAAGTIPCYRPTGKVLFFNREELDSFIMKHRVRTNDEIAREVELEDLNGKKGGRK